jgi:hypothetical protein
MPHAGLVPPLSTVRPSVDSHPQPGPPPRTRIAVRVCARPASPRGAAGTMRTVWVRACECSAFIHPRRTCASGVCVSAIAVCVCVRVCARACVRAPSGSQGARAARPGPARPVSCRRGCGGGFRATPPSVRRGAALTAARLYSAALVAAPPRRGATRPAGEAGRARRGWRGRTCLSSAPPPADAPLPCRPVSLSAGGGLSIAIGVGY